MIKTILDSLETNTIKRVDDNHILNIYIGLNLENLPIILLRTEIEISLPKSSKYIEIRKTTKDKIYSYHFSLIDMVHLDMFLDIFEDIICKSRNKETESNSLKVFVNRYTLWSNFFDKKHESVLTNNQIVGLYGELMYLWHDLVPKIGIYQAISSWFGPEMEKKDFEFETSWVEIKMVKLGSYEVKINSIFQLDDVNKGILCVNEYSFIENGNKNLYCLVTEIISKINDHDLFAVFTDKLAQIGYIHINTYRTPNIEIKKQTIIDITGDVNLLRLNNIPNTVKEVVYKLSFRELGGVSKDGPYNI